MNNATETYKLICKSCQWTGERNASASDQCPRCRNKLALAPSASRNVMRDAIKQTLTPAEKPSEPAVIQRSLRDKDAPIDEGEWEFKLSNGVLEVIAWNDSKTQASCARLVRRGTEIHAMRTAESDSDGA